MSQLEAISPIDGRYYEKLKELSEYFSEKALMRYRIMVEIKYLISLSEKEEVGEVKKMTDEEISHLEDIYHKFSSEDAEKVKKIEKKTNHDVKSIEYFIKEELEGTRLGERLEFIHFALTSEDINNLSYTLMLKDFINDLYLPKFLKLISGLRKLARANKKVAMLSLTHGQPATPTTLGKEIAVFCYRLQRQYSSLSSLKFLGKFGGATGNWAAHNVAYPEVDWIEFSKSFVGSLKLEFNPLTTQIENHDSLIEAYDIIRHINNILIDFDRDMWMYISRKLFKQQNKSGEVGSSAMPHKINPIDFENSEGNCGLANAFLQFLSNELTNSRMQRDLTDSTILRNQGVAMAHSLLTIKSTVNGLSKVVVDQERIEYELEDHWEVLAEAVQNVLRKLGGEVPYEKLKELTRGKKITFKQMEKFIKGLDINEQEKKKLLNLTPQKYTGLSERLVDKFLNRQ